jgi:hypothetical protein
VVFAFPNNGEQVDKDRLGRLGLKVGAEFTVEKTEIGGFSTTLYLREFPGERFNTVNFTLTANEERQRFEDWYDAQPGGRLSPWDVWQAASKLRGVPLKDADALALARRHLDHGLSWAPHITRCTDAEIRALIRAVEAAHGIVA